MPEESRHNSGAMMPAPTIPAPALSASAVIDAPPETLYMLIADYVNGHPRILPKPPFVSLDVEQGGVGAGTVIVSGMKVLGRVQTFRATVTEPEPGRVLVETTDTGYVTTFRVDPRPDGRSAEVTISTEITRTGVAATLERWFVTRLLRPVYVRELEQLADVARASVI